MRRVSGSLRKLGLLTVIFLLAAPTYGGENLLSHGDFEKADANWSVWSRDPGVKMALDTQIRHGGASSARIEHRGAQDWALTCRQTLPVQPGQIYELAGWAKLEGESTAFLSVVLRNDRKETLEWAFGARPLPKGSDWKQVVARFVVPDGVATIQPRLTGRGPATVWFDDASLVLAGAFDFQQAKKLPENLLAGNATLQVTFRPGDGSFEMLDRRSNRTWRAAPVKAATGLRLLDAKLRTPSAETAASGFDLHLLDLANTMEFDARVRLDASAAELVVELAAKADCPMPVRLEYPPAFATGKGTLLIAPVNEGISYPADDATLPAMSYHLYGGHGLCMPWWGQTEGEAAVMGLVETPNDAQVGIPRRDGLLCLAPQWIAERGKFGPARRIRYVFFSEGGYVAMCKRYRQYAQQTGLFKTLAQKRRENPNVDRLVGAVNVWCWTSDPVSQCRQMQEAGIGRILWSQAAKPEQLKKLNELGVLTSRYDIYQDVMDPASFPKLGGIHPDWTTEAWPKDLMIRDDGQWVRGWEVTAKDGTRIPCGVLCDRQAVDYARRRIPPELKTHPYGCRFIDTTTASPWRECHDPAHPMTRTESREFKMKLLEYICKDCNLVTGCETGHDAAVPVVHYFEGMLSLGPYRCHDSGRNIQEILEEVPEPLAKFQTGHVYRLPLWELVYHDCVVAQWYWGDYNNKLPRVWDRRDLWNALYGTPPMFLFQTSFWKQHRDRFVKSYQAATPVARATGYVEMLSHRWLSADHAVQETRYANGVRVTVNFGDQAYRLADGSMLAPLASRIEGIGGP